ncbi:MAG: TerB family tellurite resistance protein [Gammaproteobacteria bacterium]|nr:MAG: TerB family tellurite resistance protein [Gammaproteobacteria bacterium]
MLKAIRRFFDRHLAPAAGGRGAPGDRGGRGEEASLRLATAALLVEALQADHQVDPRELEAVRELLEGFFGLGREEAAELLALARREAEEAVSLFQFTRLVDRGYDPATKERIVEMLWRVAYADGHKHHWEEHLVRKVAELLHVPHGAFVRARERAARERHPGGGGPTG